MSTSSPLGTADLHVPESLRTYVESTRGQQGSAWLAALPSLVARLCDRWDLEPRGVHEAAGRSLLLRVRTSSGEPAALKIEPVASAQIPAMGAMSAVGVGPRVLAADSGLNASLLEWVEGTTGDQVAPLALLKPAVAALRRMHSAPWEGSSAPSGPEWTRKRVVIALDRLASLTDEPPFDPELLEKDATLADVNAGGDLLHGDLTAGNIIVRPTGDCALIDPEPLRGPAEIDVALLCLRLARGTLAEPLLGRALKIDESLDEGLLRWNLVHSARTYVAYRLTMGRPVSPAHLDLAQTRVLPLWARRFRSGREGER